MRRFLSIALLTLLATGSIAPSAPSDAQPQQTGDAGRIDRVLTELQARGDHLRDLRCELRFVEEDRINLTRRTKIGRIRYLVRETNPSFLIQFDRTEVDGILGKREWYLFDGRWLYEAVERIQQVTQREIARPGESLDLFDLERTPFPLPFGQKKETILQNFTVALVPPAQGDPPGTDHMACTPRPGGRFHGKYDKLEFFVRWDIHLPSRVVVTRNDGLEISTADFPDLSDRSIDSGVTEKDFAPPSAWSNYKHVVEPLEPPSP